MKHRVCPVKRGSPQRPCLLKGPLCACNKGGLPLWPARAIHWEMTGLCGGACRTAYPGPPKTHSHCSHTNNPLLLAFLRYCGSIKKKMCVCCMLGSLLYHLVKSLIGADHNDIGTHLLSFDVTCSMEVHARRDQTVPPAAKKRKGKKSTTDERERERNLLQGSNIAHKTLL